MPYQPSRRNTLLQRQCHTDAMKTIFRASPLYELDCLSAVPDYDVSEYPDLLLYLCLTCNNVTASQRDSGRTMDTPDVWPRLLAIYNHHTGTSLMLPRPPSAKMLDKFSRRVAHDKALMDSIRTGLREIASGTAVAIGYLGDGEGPDYTQIDPRNTIAGDGTYVDPYSTVRISRDADGAHIHGSRAASPETARIQLRSTEHNDDKPDARGINNVIISVPTTAGALWLNADQAMRAETTVAMALLDEVLEAHPRSVHALVYDKAVSGWLIQDLMARGVLVVGKSVVRSSKAANEEEEYDDNVAGKLKTIAADEARSRYWHDPVSGTPVPHTGPLTHAHRLPLGTSVYPTAKRNDNDELVTTLHPLDSAAKQASAIKRLKDRAAAKAAAPGTSNDVPASPKPTRSDRKKELEEIHEALVVEETRVYPVQPEWLRDHTGPEGCEHTWWLDGDALVACDRGPDRHWYKVGLAWCQTCRTHKDGNTGNHVWHMTWTVRCPNGTHTFRTVTFPTRVPADQRSRWSRTSDRNSGTELAWACLRPLARAHGDAWAIVANRRNVAESTNAWMARCLTILGPARARRLRAKEQRLDLFCIWAFRIADVYRVALLQGALDEPAVA